MPGQDPSDILPVQYQEMTKAKGHDLAALPPGRPENGEFAEKLAAAQEDAFVVMAQFEGTRGDEVHGMTAITAIGNHLAGHDQMGADLLGDALSILLGKAFENQDVVD